MPKGIRNKPKKFFSKNCVVCGTEFKAYRKNHEYCSPNCGQATYRKRHPDRKKESIRKSLAKPENMAKRKEWTKNYTFPRRLKKYGLTEEKFFSMLDWQNYRCIGCKTDIDKNTCHIDHCHTTGIVRGLLCSLCNTALGHVRENPKTLYNLLAYLERDWTKKYIYMIGSLRNPEIPYIGNKFREAGYEVMDHWWGAGEKADDAWQEYSRIKGLSYKEALRDSGAKNVFNFDRSRLEMSDIGILVMPSGKSAHLELGYMSAMGKRTFLLIGEEVERYDVMPQFVEKVCYSPEEIIEELKKEKPKPLEIEERLNAVN